MEITEKKNDFYDVTNNYKYQSMIRVTKKDRDRKIIIDGLNDTHREKVRKGILKKDRDKTGDPHSPCPN